MDEHEKAPEIKKWIVECIWRMDDNEIVDSEVVAVCSSEEEAVSIVKSNAVIDRFYRYKDPDNTTLSTKDADDFSAGIEWTIYRMDENKFYTPWFVENMNPADHE